MYTLHPSIYRWLCSLAAGFMAVIEPALPYLALCTGFVLLDCYSAWRLARRVRSAHPERASGKFRSEKLRHNDIFHLDSHHEYCISISMLP